jgi:hypothetical protein
LVASGPADPIGNAYHHLYNLDFAGAHKILDDYEAKNPNDPIGPAVRAAAYLFYELDRLRILEGEFFSNDKRISGNDKLSPDPRLRDRFFASVTKAQQMADASIKKSPNDIAALFAYCLTEGMRTDYMALIEKKQLRSLSYAKRAHNYALQVIKADPNFTDAYLTTGLTEYLVGSLPFFVRWFVKFDQVDGSKDQAVARLNRVAESGRYLGPFARILLAIIHLREKRPALARDLMAGLARDFPGNYLFRDEAKKLSLKLERR